MEIKFEWDEEKNQKNIERHGISFEVAKYVFMDEDYIEIYDETHNDEEERYIVIGYVNDVLFVVYTERGDTIRLISARLAEKAERRLYYDNKGLY